MKKRLFVALLLCVSLMLLCGCGNEGDKTEQTGQTDSISPDIVTESDSESIDSTNMSLTARVKACFDSEKTHKPTDEDGDHYETYFLNLVDEADIKALLEAAGVTETCDCGDKCIAGAVNTACDICRKNMTECLGIEKIPETQPVDPTEPSEPAEKPNEGSNSTAILAVVLLVAIGGGAVFFFVKNKKPDPKTKGNTDLNDYDYGMDDDEYAEFEADEEEEDQ